MRYFVDGYNLLMSADVFNGGSLRDRRERLLRFIEDRRPQGGASHGVTVVFDGREDVSSPRWMGPTRVIFSHGRNADAVIKESVDALANPREATVVTDDRAIRRWVRAVGAKVVSCADFLSAASPGRPRAGGTGGMLPSEADAINEELKNLWKLK